MSELTVGRENYLAERKKGGSRYELKGLGRYLPAGQTTQMIVGASPETDGRILKLTQFMYRKFDLRRVYYSAYIPVVDDPLLPTKTTGLLREHRLYQADWLLRFYGFTADELINDTENLATEYDPKCAWALKNMQFFPIEVNKASVEELLRVPGIGTKGAYKIVSARRHTTLTFDTLKKMRIVLKRAQHFITCDGKFYGSDDVEHVKFRLALAEQTETGEQLSLFSKLTTASPTEATIELLRQDKRENFLLHSNPSTGISVLTGQF
jgi:predicted DNA-binding helix-hairpin-helix protein